MKKLTKEEKRLRKKQRRDIKLREARQRGRKRQFNKFEDSNPYLDMKWYESIIDYI